MCLPTSLVVASLLYGSLLVCGGSGNGTTSQDVAFATGQGKIANRGFILIPSTNTNPKQLLLFCSEIPKFVLSMVRQWAAWGQVAQQRGHWRGTVWGACMPPEPAALGKAWPL